MNDTEIEKHSQEEWGGWKFVSEMLDAPHSGIFQTSKCYEQLYDFVMAQKAKARLERDEKWRKGVEELIKEIPEGEITEYSPYGDIIKLSKLPKVQEQLREKLINLMKE